MARAPQDDFDVLLDDIEREAVSEGPAAVQDLRALQVKYRLINVLIERRHALHWTQKQLSAHSGIGQAEISKIERGRKSPTLDTYIRLVTALDLDEDIVGGNRPRQRAAS
jgi:DNA-binding XRE family transcriptional regulator